MHSTEKNNELIAIYLMGWYKSEYTFNKYYWYVIEEMMENVASRELKFHRDWDHLMEVVDKVRSFPSSADQPKDIPIGWTCLGRFELTKFGIFLEIDTFTDKGWKSMHSYHRYVPDDPDASDCDSYFETVYKAMLDVAIWFKDHGQTI